MTSLESIDLKDNRLGEWPSELSLVPSLKEVDLTLNNLDPLLPSIANVQFYHDKHVWRSNVIVVKVDFVFSRKFDS
jgi:hypothetical protein